MDSGGEKLAADDSFNTVALTHADKSKGLNGENVQTQRNESLTQKTHAVKDSDHNSRIEEIKASMDQQRYHIFTYPCAKNALHYSEIAKK